MEKENRKSKILPKDNIILASGAYLPPDKVRNILLFGGSGMAKPFYYTEPNLMQCNTSYVCADPSGILYQQFEILLEHQGYKVKCLNLAKMDKGNHYNPFRYIHNNEDIEALVKTLFANTTSLKKAWDEPSKRKAETALLTALIAYLHHHAVPKEQNFTNVMNLLRTAYFNPLDQTFQDIEDAEPESFTAIHYKEYKKYAGKYNDEIVLSCSVRLQAFDLRDVVELTKTDDIDLETVCNEKTALFVITPPNISDFHFNFLASIMYTQLLDIIAKQNFKGGHSTHLIMDQAEMVTIPKFASRLDAAQKHGLITSLFIRSPAFMTKKYGRDWENISEKCDAAVLLGQGEIDVYDWFRDYAGLTAGPRKRMFFPGDDRTAYLEDVRTLSEGECLVYIKGSPTIREWKYTAVDHPSWGNVKNTVSQ